jgi:hypothetical protein
MNLRHAAALALVGWYLLVPPLSSDLSRFDISAPFSKWTLLTSTDTADRCTEIKSKWSTTKFGDVWVNHHYPAEARKTARLALHQSECIATDDPRLMEK